MPFQAPSLALPELSQTSLDPPEHVLSRASLKFHSATGVVQVSLLPGTQYKELDEFRGVLEESTERDPRTIALPRLYSVFNSSAVRAKL